MKNHRLTILFFENIAIVKKLGALVLVLVVFLSFSYAINQLASYLNYSQLVSDRSLQLAQVIPPLTNISQAGWTLHSVDSQQTGGNEAVKAFDGNTATLWHSKYWTTPIDPIPHEIQINLGATYTIAGVRYLGRQDGGINGRVAGYEFYVSSDGSSWGSPVAQGTFPNTTTQQEVTFASVSARYVRFRALSAVTGSGVNFTSLAEL